MGEQKYPMGTRFSHIYAERGRPTVDSPVFRMRVGRYVSSKLDLISSGIAERIGIEFGPFVFPQDIDKFLVECELRRVLDFITLTFDEIQANPEYIRLQAYNRQHDDLNNWKRFVSGALREENLHYRLDDTCVVHYSQDEEFDRAMAATIAGLGAENFGAARKFFEDGLKDLMDPAQSGRAVRHVFDAVENVFKGRYGTSLLGSTEIAKYLQPSSISSNQTEQDSMGQVIASFQRWSNAAQKYRHAPGTAEPQPPSQDFAVLMVSQGAAYLRWLISLANVREPK